MAYVSESYEDVAVLIPCYNEAQTIDSPGSQQQADAFDLAVERSGDERGPEFTRRRGVDRKSTRLNSSH